MANQAQTGPLGDAWHNGVNNAGNKSFCAYRIGVGVPGYTGFVPVSENISVPAKRGCAERAELQHGEGPHGDGGTVLKPATSHKSDFSITPAQFRDATQPNALWDIKETRPIGDPPFIRRPKSSSEPRPFNAKSTFREAFANSKSQQEYPSDVTKLGQLRPPNSSDDASNPFFSTEYGQKSLQINKATHMTGKKMLAKPVEITQRANPDIASVTLRHPQLATSHRTDFGEFGVDPNSKMASDPSQISLCATTGEQSKGTTKATYHPPGYSGFIPRTTRNDMASSQGKCTQARESTKAFELSTLFQYPQDVPGYAGYRPQTMINDVGPDRNLQLTTTGRFLSSATNNFRPGDLGLAISNVAQRAPQPSAHAKQSSIRQDLFSHEAATGTVSDNGRHDADLYYSKTRPMEGRSVAIIKQGHWNQAA